MNAAVALFTDRLLGHQRYAVPFRAAGIEARGRVSYWPCGTASGADARTRPRACGRLGRLAWPLGLVQVGSPPMIEKPFDFRIGLGTSTPQAARPRAGQVHGCVQGGRRHLLRAATGRRGRVGVRFEPYVIHVKWIPAAGAADLSTYAVELLQQRDYASAIPLLESLLGTDPDDPVALYNLGMAYSDMGRLDEAKRSLGKLVRLQPDNPNAVVALGVAQVRSGDRKAAEETLQRAVDLDPTERLCAPQPRGHHRRLWRAGGG